MKKKEIEEMQLELMKYKEMSNRYLCFLCNKDANLDRYKEELEEQTIRSQLLEMNLKKERESLWCKIKNRIALSIPIREIEETDGDDGYEEEY